MQSIAVLESCIDADTMGTAVPVLDRTGRALAALGVVVPLGHDAVGVAVTSLGTASRAVALRGD